MSVHPGDATIWHLREGNVINLQGLLFRKIEGDITPGSTYIGARNTVDLYICKFVKDGAVYPEGKGYAFERTECQLVELLDDDTIVADYVVPEKCFR